MGRSPRDKPRELGDKLKKIRVDLLNLSQTEMAKALALTINYAAVSHYELGTREPSLLTLLRYARLVGISTDVLIDDKLDFPKKVTKRPYAIQNNRARRELSDHQNRPKC
jgi:transcriptional regulator with XRE-family HTH domain